MLTKIMTMDDNNDDDNHGNDKDYDDGNDGQGWEFAHLISENCSFFVQK